MPERRVASLLSKVAAMPTPPPAIYRFSGLTLDLVRGCLRNERGALPLRPKSFQVLNYFVSNAGRLLSKDELMQAGWPGVFVTEDSLVQCVKEIRRVMGDGAQVQIKTVPGRGYIFDLPVTLVGPAGSAATGRELPHGADWLEWVRAIDWRIVAAALVLVSGGLGWWLLAPSRPDTRERLSMVVLPFVNLSNDPDQEYFADGFTDILTTDLSRIPGSFVIARNTAYTYKGKAGEAKQIGRELGVRYLVEGSVQQSSNQIRVNAQLIDAETGSHLWAESFDRERGDLFAIEDEITKRIAHTLDLQLTNIEAQRAERRGTSADAMDYVMRGDVLGDRPVSKDNYGARAEMYERALQLDEHLLPALTGLASVLESRVLDEWSDAREDDLRRAEDLVSRALAVEPNYFPAHFVKGQILRAQRHYDEAIAEYETVIALNPMAVGARSHLARAKILIGEPAEAIPLLEQALRISPRDSNIGYMHWRLGLANLLLGNTEEAIRWNEKAGLTYYAPADAYLNLAAALGLKGDKAGAQAALAEAAKHDPHASTTLAEVKRRRLSDRPKFVELSDRTVVEGLRKAGMPEE
jgi:adenylate cyclase